VPKDSENPNENSMGDGHTPDQDMSFHFIKKWRIRDALKYLKCCFFLKKKHQNLVIFKNKIENYEI